MLMRKPDSDPATVIQYSGSCVCHLFCDVCCGLSLLSVFGDIISLVCVRIMGMGYGLLIVDCGLDCGLCLVHDGGLHCFVFSVLCFCGSSSAPAHMTCGM